MRTANTISEVEHACRTARDGAIRIGLVPTMGALHEGHLSLVRAAKADCQFVVVSIFVNPTQFGAGEDLAKYPRTLDRDGVLLEAEGVDVLFAPSVEEMYPSVGVTWVTAEGLSDRLDGRSRPGHFRGVSTVVAKLFHIVRPDVAFFGQKDAAQLAIIRKMVRDLNFPIEVVGGPIVREPDGLAMSSRNVYLNAAQRWQALALHRALSRIAKMHEQGVRDAGTLAASGKEEIAAEPGIQLDFLEIVDRDTLEPVVNVSGGVLVAAAAYVGTTRLIDNIILAPDKGH
jgi:pantoate--beta-alanine ligase